MRARAATLVDAGATEDFGARLAGLLAAGDVVILDGPLGAGKTTLVRGLGAGLGVRGPITSPTFVIARLHPSLVGGPSLVHVDAYRLAGAVDLDQLDLDAEIERSVTVIEWGAGLAEALAAEYLLVTLVRDTGGEGVPDESRQVEVVGHGPRWAEVDFEAVLG